MNIEVKIFSTSAVSPSMCRSIAVFSFDTAENFFDFLSVVLRFSALSCLVAVSRCFFSSASVTVTTRPMVIDA